MSVAERVTVVEAKDVSLSTSSIQSLQAGFSAAGSYFDIPYGTPFYTDETKSWVNERSAKIFDQVNSMLCMLDLSGYEDMMNQGFYKAQIDQNLCPVPDEYGSVYFSEVPVLRTLIINSIRPDASSPHVVEVWLQKPDSNLSSNAGVEGGNGNNSAQVKATIYESKSETNPFGLFRMDYIFTTYEDYSGYGGASDYARITHGFMETVREPDTNGVMLKYADNLDDEYTGAWSYDGSDGNTYQNTYESRHIKTQLASLTRHPNAELGNGALYLYKYSFYNSSTDDPNGWEYYDQQEDEEQSVYSFNDTHFWKDIVNSTIAPEQEYCFFRDAFYENVWQYGLYDNEGNRFDLNTGFPIRYPHIINGTDYYGWASNWGIWTSSPDPIQEGESVWKQEYYSSGSLLETEYKVETAGGRLTRYYKTMSPLSDFEGMPFEFNFYDGKDWVYYKIEWSGSELVQTAYQDTDTWQWVYLDYPVPLDLTQLNSYEVYLYSSGIGSVEMQIDGCTQNTPKYTWNCDGMVNASTPVYISTYSYVTPDNIPSELLTNGLICFSYCPDASIINGTDTSIINSTSAYYATSTDGSLTYQNVPPASATAFYYTFNSGTKELFDEQADRYAIFDAEGTDLWGVYSGAMVTNTTANRDALGCDYDPTNTTCAYNIYNLDDYYYWETGPEQWSKLTSLYVPDTVPRQYVVFDQPMSMKYVHKGGDRYNNRTYMLTYSGFGQLWGFNDYFCIKMDTGLLDPDCNWETGPTWWVQAPTIPVGGKLVYSYKDNAGNTLEEEYFAKPIHKMQFMIGASNYACDVIEDKQNYDSYEIPALDEWQDPALGPEPLIGGPPAVIDGELQLIAPESP